MAAQGEHRFGGGLRSPGNAETELKERRRVDQALADERFREPYVPQLEALDLRLHADRLDAPGHLAQDPLGCEKRPLAEVERAAIEGADLGQKLLDMRDAFGGARHVGARPARPGICGIEKEVAAHAGGEIDDDVDARRADETDRLAVKRRIARRLAGLGIAHMQVHDRRARAAGLERRFANLARRHRDRGVLAGRVAGAGHGAGNDDVLVQSSPRNVFENFAPGSPIAQGLARAQGDPAPHAEFPLPLRERG